MALIELLSQEISDEIMGKSKLLALIYSSDHSIQWQTINGAAVLCAKIQGRNY